MSGKIKVIIKRPDEKAGHMTNISASLENLRRTVGGHIETCSIAGLVIVCNEEGKIRQLEPNFKIPFDYICGTAIICGIANEDFGDIPISFSDWKAYLKAWGNEV